MAPNITILKLQESSNSVSTGNTSSAHNSADSIWINNISLSDSKNITNTTSSNGLSQEDQKIYNKIYEKIKELCAEHNINVDLAKNFNLIGKILGKSQKELVELVKTEQGQKEIDNIINVLKDHLGLGDGLGFGEKDTLDLENLTKDVQNKIAREKVGGSWVGQKWHNIKNIIGLDSVYKLNTPEGFCNYYKKEFLGDINGLSKTEIKDRYSKLLTQFYYDFKSLEDSPKKQVAMTKAIALLAADNRDLIIEIMEVQLNNDPEALQEFGKAINDNKNIVKTPDALGNIPTQQQATKIANTAFRNMSEEDVKQALELLKKDATKFYEQYGETIKELKARRDKGEALSEEEVILLTEAENVYESQYAGATTGILSNNNIIEANQIKYVSQINNDTQEIGIQDEVFDAIKEFIEENPDELGMSENDFNELMDKATNENYTKYNVRTKTPDTNADESAQTTIPETNYQESTTVSTSTELDNRIETESSIKTTYEDNAQLSEYNNIGFTVKNEIIDENKEKATSLNISKENETKETTNKKYNFNDKNSIVEATKKGGVKAYYEILSEGNQEKILAETFNNKTSFGNDIINAAKNIYKSFKSTQINILEKLSANGIYIIDSITSNATWNKAANKTFGSFEVTKLIHEKAELSIEQKA